MIHLMAMTVFYGKMGRNKYLGKPIVVQRFPNDFFDDKLNIYDEKDWQKFIVNYRLKGDKPLPYKDNFGNELNYAIRVNGSSADMRKYFGRKHQGALYLFPQVTKIINLRSGTGEPVISYNEEFIKPYLKRGKKLR